jgi:Fic family protein
MSFDPKQPYNDLPLLPPPGDLETKPVLINAIRDLFDQTLARCRAKLPAKVYSKELVELVFTQPYCKIQFLVDADIAERKTASAYLQELEKLGILKGEKQGREVIYKHPGLLKVLTT